MANSIPVENIYVSTGEYYEYERKGIAPFKKSNGLCFYNFADVTPLQNTFGKLDSRFSQLIKMHTGDNTPEFTPMEQWEEKDFIDLGDYKTTSGLLVGYESVNGKKYEVCLYNRLSGGNYGHNSSVPDLIKGNQI